MSAEKNDTSDSLRPTGDRVLVVPDAPADTTDSGLILVSSHDDIEMSGVVAFIGPGPRCQSCGGPLRTDVAVGDRVVFAPNKGSEVEIDGTRYIVLAQDDLLGIVED